MEVISTNIAKPTAITWNGQNITTGIYKKPITGGILLEKENVRGDEVSNRKVHGGEFKACYMFSADYYPYWKNLYPDLNWNYGMFGENLTIKGLDENELHIGDIYKIGNAIVQVTQPREPCFKFGYKFGNQKVLKQFIEHNHSGVYTKVLQEGIVKTNDILHLIERPENSLTVSEFFKLLFHKEKDQGLLKIALLNHAIPMDKRKQLASFLR